jgi:hypothetical protein
MFGASVLKALAPAVIAETPTITVLSSGKVTLDGGLPGQAVLKNSVTAWSPTPITVARGYGRLIDISSSRIATNHAENVKN